MFNANTPSEAFEAILRVETFSEDDYDVLVARLREAGLAIAADHLTAHVEVLTDTDRESL